MKPQISILMANYNKALYIKDAVNSVLKQDFQDWELIIIDDCSTDESVVLIKPYLSDRRIRFFQNNKNIGKTETLKQLVAKADGEILGILDSDDALNPSALSEIIKVYKENSDCGFIYSQCIYCDEKLKPKHVGFSAKIPVGKSNLHCNCVVAMRTFKKKAYFKTVGYGNEIIFAEDIDLVLKIEEVTKLYFINKPLYYYRILPMSQSHSFKNTQINRSSTALAKFNAYKRRLKTFVHNLSGEEICSVLFFGIFSAVLAKRFRLAGKFVKELFKIDPFIFLKYKFYFISAKKVKKIAGLKIDSIC